MEEIQSLSDAQLREELISRGVKNLGPVCGTSRGIYEKKLFKLRNEGDAVKSTPKKASIPVKTASTSRTVKTITRKNRTDNEELKRKDFPDGSDDEIQVVSPKPTTKNGSTTKPITSTPTKDRTPSPTPKKGRGRPANKIIPGMNTTSAGKSAAKSSLLIGSPTIDIPGSTPPRRILRTPTRAVTHTDATVTTSYVSPDTSFGRLPSPKFTVHEAISKRGLSNLGHTTEEDDSDDGGEEIQRTIHNIVSTGKDARGIFRKAMDSMLGNNLSASVRPGDSYDLRRGSLRTSVVRDSRSGKLSIKQKSIWSDIPRILMIILILFFVLLGIAYLVASRPETVAGTFSVLKNAAKDTIDAFYRYAILPVALITGGSVLVTALYFIHRWYREKQLKEQEAFEDLVERIIDTVQLSADEGNENITVPHIRDKMYPPAKRSAADLKLWERAVNFINENESRIATECVLIRGQECQVWRWIPYKKSGWQGSAYSSTSKKSEAMLQAEKALSPNIPKHGLTRCLKVRNVKDIDNPSNPQPVDLAKLKMKVMEKLWPVRPVHMQFDSVGEEKILYIKFISKDDAKDAFTALHATWFNGNLITVKYMRDERYADRFPVTVDV